MISVARNMCLYQCPWYFDLPLEFPEAHQQVKTRGHSWSLWPQHHFLWRECWHVLYFWGLLSRPWSTEWHLDVQCIIVCLDWGGTHHIWPSGWEVWTGLNNKFSSFGGRTKMGIFPELYFQRLNQIDYLVFFIPYQQYFSHIMMALSKLAVWFFTSKLAIYEQNWQC